MPKFEIQVGRDARVYYKATIEAESLEAAMAMHSRHGFDAPEGTEWIADGADDFDQVETLNISQTVDGEDVLLASFDDNDGWSVEA
jgi:hypothetical protein